eukprot:1757798-Pleurochrysis_carterae.AAC.1
MAERWWRKKSMKLLAPMTATMVEGREANQEKSVVQHSLAECIKFRCMRNKWVAQRHARHTLLGAADIHTWATGLRCGRRAGAACAFHMGAATPPRSWGVRTSAAVSAQSRRSHITTAAIVVHVYAREGTDATDAVPNIGALSQSADYGSKLLTLIPRKGTICIQK